MALSNALQLAVVVEGIETAGQLRLVNQLGCEIAQGYFIAEPMAEKDFLDWYKARDRNFYAQNAQPSLIRKEKVPVAT